ncbi:MAG: hypothetical protein F4018_19805 [Acidobacteria bacterium]|nr:hypothetical protein [Acidobacteriota bacterium]MYK90403.1 hypothetical protein [Acidobacteriota bacterium]
MRSKCAVLILLLVGFAGCSGRAGITAPVAASTAPGETAAIPQMTKMTPAAVSQAGCTTRGERRPTAFTRYWLYS